MRRARAGNLRIGRAARAALAAALAFLLFACSGKEESPAPGGATPPPSAAAPSSADNSTAAAPADGPLVVREIEPGARGGRLVMSLTGDPKTLNPLLTEDVDSTQIGDFLFERLYSFDRAKQEEVPRLAHAWEYREATREWVFHLRKDLKWSDGAPLTSGDLMFFVEAMNSDHVPNIFRDKMTAGGKPYKFSAPDPLTFIAEIPEVDSFAFVNLIEVKAVPRHKLEGRLADGTFVETLGVNTPPGELVTSGPFRLKEFRSGERFGLEANPHYFARDERGQELPYLSELLVLILPSFDAMAIRFQAGDTDVLETILPQSLNAIEDGAEAGGYALVSPGLRLAMTHYWFNLKPGGSYEGENGKREFWDPPAPDAAPPAEILARGFRYYIDPVKRRWFENREFRIACSMASNRDVMVKTVLFGEGEPLYSFESAGNKRWHNPDVPKFPYDIAKAAATLEAAGFIDRDGDGTREDSAGNPVRFTLVTNKENSMREKIAVLLKEDLKKIGFDVTLQSLDFNDIVTRTNDTYDYEACLLGLESGVPPHPADASNIIPSRARMHTWNPGQKTPATPQEAKIDELYERMKKTFDLAEQKKLYDEIQWHWADLQGMIQLVALRANVASRDTLGNVKPTVLRPYLTHNPHEIFLRAR